MIIIITIMRKKWHFCARKKKRNRVLSYERVGSIWFFFFIWEKYNLRQLLSVTNLCVCVCERECRARVELTLFWQNTVTTIHTIVFGVRLDSRFVRNVLYRCFLLLNACFSFVKNFFFPISMEIKTRTAHGASSCLHLKRFRLVFFLWLDVFSGFKSSSAELRMMALSMDTRWQRNPRPSSLRFPVFFFFV